MVLQKINSLFGVQIAYSDAIHSEAEFEAWADELKVAVLLITRTHSSLEKKLKETEQRVADEWQYFFPLFLCINEVTDKNETVHCG